MIDKSIDYLVSRRVNYLFIADRNGLCAHQLFLDSDFSKQTQNNYLYSLSLTPTRDSCDISHVMFISFIHRW